MAELIAAEVAEAEFDRWAEAMDLKRKLEHPAMNAESKEGLAVQRRVLLDAIMQGNLAVDDLGQFVFRPQIGDQSPITFFEPDGACLMAVDQIAKQGHREVAKGFAILAAMTKQNAPRFAKMKVRDYTVCEAVQVLFLAKV
jgi:hypothetical protein